MLFEHESLTRSCFLVVASIDTLIEVYHLGVYLSKGLILASFSFFKVVVRSFTSF